MLAGEAAVFGEPCQWRSGILVFVVDPSVTAPSEVFLRVMIDVCPYRWWEMCCGTILCPRAMKGVVCVCVWVLHDDGESCIVVYCHVMLLKKDASSFGLQLTLWPY